MHLFMHGGHHNHEGHEQHHWKETSEEAYRRGVEEGKKSLAEDRHDRE
jgi:hypothetical protein